MAARRSYFIHAPSTATLRTAKTRTAALRTGAQLLRRTCGRVFVEQITRKSTKQNPWGMKSRVIWDRTRRCKR